MALMPCPECKKEISSRASSCPDCGCPIHPKKQEKHGIALPIIAILFVLSILGSFITGQETDAEKRNKIAAANKAYELAQKEEKVTAEREAKAELAKQADRRSKWRELSGSIWTGVKVYQGAGDEKSYTFEVLGGSEDCKLLSSGRGLYVEFENGTREWKDRNAMINNRWLFVAKNDPAIMRMHWKVYPFC